MEVPNDRLRILLQQYADDAATETEQQELFSLITHTNDNDLESSLIVLLQSIQPDYDEARRRRILDLILANVNEGRNGRKDYTKDAKVIPLYRRKAFRWAAAAVVIAAVLTSVILLTVGVPGKKQGTEQIAITHDVSAPKETRAVITLADGTKVYLDSVNTGTIAQETDVNVVKTADGKIAYNLPANSQQLTANSPVYNTLYNPRGSKVIDMTLSDGTHVWLNAGSSIKYPVAFVGNERAVEMTGEAYFEVKHNARQPFKVHLPNGSVVEDIGTSFNINAYPDENATKTTLIEGSIKVSSRLSVFVAKPKAGEQVVEKPNSPLTTDQSPDLEEVLAWKNGLFQFSNADIKTVMRQLARWYDIEVVYEGNIPVRKFEGKIQRDLSLNDVLEPLAKNQVHFKIEGKRITITP